MRTPILLRLPSDVVKLLNLYMDEEYIQHLNTALDRLLLEYTRKYDGSGPLFQNSYTWPSPNDEDTSYLYKIPNKVLTRIDNMVSEAFDKGYTRITGANRSGVIYNLIRLYVSSSYQTSAQIS